MTRHIPPPLKALAARVSPRRYLKGIVIEAIEDERRTANLRAIQHELAMAEHMARTTSMSYAEAARLLDPRGQLVSNGGETGERRAGLPTGVRIDPHRLRLEPAHLPSTTKAMSHPGGGPEQPVNVGILLQGFAGYPYPCIP